MSRLYCLSGHSSSYVNGLKVNADYSVSLLHTNKPLMRRILLTLLISIPALTIGQKLDMDLIKGIKPRSIGPAGMAGRVTTIDAVNSRPEVIYVGTASGGLWKSESGGIAWKPIFDDQTTASIGAVAIQQSNPSVIWVGTGEGNPRNSLNGGDGIYKSLDAGKDLE